jgi:hypothetical protein
MRKIIFLLLLISTMFNGKSQLYIQTENMINDCFNDCLNYCLSRGIISAVAIDHYPFGFRFPDSTITKISDNQLNYICIANPKLSKSLRKGQYTLLFGGIFLEDNKVIIWFSRRHVQRTSKYLYFAISDWYKYIYEYSNDEKHWILVDKEFGGI